MKSARQIFETLTYTNFGSMPHGLSRKLTTGEYVNDTIEDHWQTFQEGWEEGIKWFKESFMETY